MYRAYGLNFENKGPKIIMFKVPYNLYKVGGAICDSAKHSSISAYQLGFLNVPVRGTKHWNPKFKWLRQKKVIPLQLPDYHEKLTKEKVRSRLKEMGVMPNRYWKERPIYVSSLNEIIDPYIPPAGDGKASILSKKFRETTVDALKSKKSHMSSMRAIKSYEPEFNIKLFPQIAHDIYVKAHTVLMKNDPEELSDYVTEKAIIDMREGLKLKTLKWKFIESLEPPSVVHVRTAEAFTQTNLFAQITVRFHTKQFLAIYDRFGRLFYGSEAIPKDVLEFIVFEKHIVNEYGKWRMHGKIIPDWVSSPEPPHKTFIVEEIEEDDLAELVEEDQVDNTSFEVRQSDTSESNYAKGTF